MSEENKRIPIYKKTWFIIVMLIFIFPVGLILMWMHKDWSRKVKGVVTAVTLLFALFVYTPVDDDEETADTTDEQVAVEEAEETPEEEVEESDEPENEEVEEPVEKTSSENQESNEEDQSDDRDVITIAKEHDYVIDSNLIEGTYTASINREVQNYSANDELHYNIQIEHNGGFFGLNNLERINEVVESITEEQAEYDYLVFEVIRTDNDGEVPERWLFARFNQEQAGNLLNEDEINDGVVESTADAFVEGGQADVGFNETIIGVNEEISFSEFTVTVDNVKIIDGEAEVSMMFRNDSDPSGLRFISALGMDVHQGDDVLDETSGEHDNVGSNQGIFYEHDAGIESPIDLTYELVDDETPIRIVFVPLLYEFEDNKEITIELN